MIEQQIKIVPRTMYDAIRDQDIDGIITLLENLGLQGFKSHVALRTILIHLFESTSFSVQEIKKCTLIIVFNVSSKY